MPTPLAPLVKSFVLALRADGLNPRSVEIYTRKGIVVLIDWMTAEGREPAVEHLTRECVRSWVAHMNDKGLMANTIAQRLAGVRRFSNWLVDEGELARNPCTGIKRPDPKEKPVPVIADSDLTALIRACSGAKFNDKRDEAMLRFMVDCGVRAGELLGMNVEDMDVHAGCVKVTGKYGKQRIVYFGSKTARALDRYLRAREGHTKAHLPDLWLSQRGALGHYGLANRIDVRAESAGLTHMHPHQFRHTFAHMWLRDGGNEGDLMRLGGWSDRRVMARYGASAADERAREAARRMSLGDRI